MKVTFQIEGGSPVQIECNAGDNLLELARRANVAIDAPCSGNGSCGKCRVKLIEGALETIQSRHITDEEYEAGWRLSCNSKVLSDCTVFVPDIASAYQSRMKTADLSSPKEIAIFENAKADLMDSGIEFTNDFLALDVVMDAPTLDDTMPDNERLTWGIKAQLEVEQVHIPFAVMVKLAHTLREHDFHVCVKGRHDGDTFYCMEICDPADTAIVGCAIDIGTTTVTMVLTDLTSGKLLAKGSSGNGQIRYGADVINRIIQQGRPGGKKKLQDAIIKETLTPIIASLCKSAGISARSILRLAIGANTTMNHLLLGVDAEPVRMEPYIPSFFGWEGLLAGDLKLPANPLAPVVIAPNIGSYVGGDITAGTLAAGIWDKDEMSLFIDLGTNGELVFGNRDFLMSCACSAGPAFEGGDISCGMRATDGAIEACVIDKETMEPTLTIVGEKGQKPVGICGSGIIDLLAQMRLNGWINIAGELDPKASHRIVYLPEEGQYAAVYAWENESATGEMLCFSQRDIHQYLDTKAAAYTMIDCILDTAGVTERDIHKLYLSGAFPAHSDLESAIAIGIFPDLPREKYALVKNSSLDGARKLLLDRGLLAEAKDLAENTYCVQFASVPDFLVRMQAAKFIPHTDMARFPSVKV